jgi:hypothetical protein
LRIITSSIGKGLENIDNSFHISNNFTIKGVGVYMARIVIENVPEEIKVGFKAICTVHNTTMRDALLKYITSRVEQETKRTNEGLVVKIK